jgi:hypothetical protein
LGTPNQIDFKGAEVVRFTISGSALDLEMEDVSVDRKMSRVIVTVSPISIVQIDDKVSETVAMEGQNGEILELEINKNSLFLIIVWVDYLRPGNEKFFTKSYRVSGGKISVSVI